MKVLSAVANKKYDSSSKQATRYVEDVEEAITTCKKNIKRKIEDAQDEVSRQIRIVEQKIEDLSGEVSINWDRKIDEVLENATSYGPKEFLLKLDRIFQDKEAGQLEAKENAAEVETLSKCIEIAKGCLSTSSFTYTCKDFEKASSLMTALIKLEESLNAAVRMNNIEEILNSEVSEEVIAKDK